MTRYKNLIMCLCAAVSALLLMAASASAQAIARAYGTDVQLQRGMIVRLSEKDKNKVVALSTKTADKMEGVVVAANDTPVTLSSSDQSKQQVFVATTGRYNVLVSDQNGTITVNDHVTISALEGIGMSAGTEKSLVVGKALAAFDGKTNVSGTSKLKDADGRDKTVKIGLIPVDISISRNPQEARQTSQLVPGLGFLQAGANAIVNKSVDPSRVYLSVLLLILTMAVGGSLLYGGVRSSMVAIGRNPLAKKSIIRNLIQVVLVSLIILIIGLFGVYLILKL